MSDFDFGLELEIGHGTRLELGSPHRPSTPYFLMMFMFGTAELAPGRPQGSRHREPTKGSDILDLQPKRAACVVFF